MKSTGRSNLRYNNVETYFTLKKENDKLSEQNAQLLNKLKTDYDFRPDSVSRQLITDTFSIDSIGAIPQISIPARKGDQ